MKWYYQSCKKVSKKRKTLNVKKKLDEETRVAN